MASNFFKFMTILTLSIMVGSCTLETHQEKVNDNNEVKKSLWTESQKKDFVDKYAESDFDRFVLAELVKQAEYKKTDSALVDFLDTDKYEHFKRSMAKRYTVTVDDLAGKIKSKVEKVLGRSSFLEKVNPSGTPCPCERVYYLDDIVEVVFINGKADWITINNDMQYAKIKNKSSYVSMDRFSDYTYVKVATK